MCSRLIGFPFQQIGTRSIGPVRTRLTRRRGSSSPSLPLPSSRTSTLLKSRLYSDLQVGLTEGLKWPPFQNPNPLCEDGKDWTSLTKVGTFLFWNTTKKWRIAIRLKSSKRLFLALGRRMTSTSNELRWRDSAIYWMICLYVLKSFLHN